MQAKAWFRNILGVTAVAALALAVYLPALRNGFVWDDRQLIVENEALVRPGANRPLVTASYIANRRLFGLDPTGYHATNLIVHACVAALVFLLLIGLRIRWWHAFAAASLFAVHPALAESVAWISGRTDAMAAGFVLLCLVLDRRRDALPLRLLSLVFLAAALLTKEIAVVTPLIATLVASIAIAPASSSAKTPPIGIYGALWQRFDMLALLAAYFLLRWFVLGAATPRVATLSTGFPWPVRLAAIPHLIGMLLRSRTWAGRSSWGCWRPGWAGS